MSSSLGLTSVQTILRFVKKSSENVKYNSHVINNTTTMTNGTREPHLTEYNKLKSGQFLQSGMMSMPIKTLRPDTSIASSGLFKKQTCLAYASATTNPANPLIIRKIVIKYVPASDISFLEQSCCSLTQSLNYEPHFAHVTHWLRMTCAVMQQVCTGDLQAQGLMNLELTRRYLRQGAFANKSLRIPSKKGFILRSGILFISSSFLKNRIGNSLLQSLQTMPDCSSSNVPCILYFLPFLSYLFAFQRPTQDNPTLELRLVPKILERMPSPTDDRPVFDLLLRCDFDRLILAYSSPDFTTVKLALSRLLFDIYNFSCSQSLLITSELT